MKLEEIFDSKIENLQWEKHGDYELAGFYVNHIPYTIQIEQKTIPNVNGLFDYKTAEISYFRTDKDNNDAFKTTGESEFDTYALYGVLINALINKFEDYEAFYFSVERRHSTNDKEYRQKRYLNRTLVKRLMSSVSYNTYDYEYDAGAYYAHIISKVKIDDPKFKNALREALSKCNFPHVDVIRDRVKK